jgi:hypothetical protein
MSRKVFTAGEVLAAADVNNFLMNQTVMSFAGTASRSASIGTPVLGMYTHLEDSPQRLQFWDGSTWISPFGLTHIRTTAFTAQTTVTINDVFSAAYDNYLVEFIATQNTSASELTFTLVNGSTPAASNWNHNGHIIASGTQFLNQGSSQAAIYRVDANSTEQVRQSIKLTGPFLTVPTQAERDSYVRATGFGANDARWFKGILNNNTSYEGIRFITSAGTMTGTIRIYGLRNS